MSTAATLAAVVLAAVHGWALDNHLPINGVRYEAGGVVAYLECQDSSDALLACSQWSAALEYAGILRLTEGPWTAEAGIGTGGPMITFIASYSDE